MKEQQIMRETWTPSSHLRTTSLSDHRACRGLDRKPENVRGAAEPARAIDDVETGAEPQRLPRAIPRRRSLSDHRSEPNLEPNEERPWGARPVRG